MSKTITTVTTITTTTTTTKVVPDAHANALVVTNESPDSDSEDAEDAEDESPDSDSEDAEDAEDESPDSDSEDAEDAEDESPDSDSEDAEDAEDESPDSDEPPVDAEEDFEKLASKKYNCPHELINVLVKFNTLKNRAEFIQNSDNSYSDYISKFIDEKNNDNNRIVLDMYYNEYLMEISKHYKKMLYAAMDNYDDKRACIFSKVNRFIKEAINTYTSEYKDAKETGSLPVKSPQEIPLELIEFINGAGNTVQEYINYKENDYKSYNSYLKKDIDYIGYLLSLCSNYKNYFDKNYDDIDNAICYLEWEHSDLLQDLYKEHLKHSAATNP